MTANPLLGAENHHRIHQPSQMKD